MQTALAALRLRLAASRPPADAAALVAEIEDCVTVLNGINDRLVDLEQQLSTAAADRSALTAVLAPTGASGHGSVAAAAAAAAPVNAFGFSAAASSGAAAAPAAVLTVKRKAPSGTAAPVATAAAAAAAAPAGQVQASAPQFAFAFAPEMMPDAKKPKPQ